MEFSKLYRLQSRIILTLVFPPIYKKLELNREEILSVINTEQQQELAITQAKMCLKMNAIILKN